MKLVALVQTPKDPTPLARILCERLGFAPAEALMRLAGEAPLVLARQEDAAADALCAELCKAGAAALAVAARPPGDADRLVARRLEFTSDAVVFEPRLGPPVALPYAAVSVLLRGLQLSRETQIHTETKRKFSLGKALITQGLSMTTTEKKEFRTEVESADQFLYVYGGDRPVAIYENEVAFTCLGTDVQPSRIANLLLVTERLRAKAPHAFFDDRLLRMARRSAPFDGGRAADLLAELLYQAVEQGLLP